MSRLVLFLEDGQLQLGACLEDRGERLRVLTPLQRETVVSRGRVLSQGAARSSTREALLQELRGRIERQEALARQVNAEELWELVQGEGDFSPRELAELCFARVELDEEAALLRALLSERVHFQLRGGRLSARSPEQVRQIRLQLERERQREEMLSERSAWLRRAWRGEAPARPELVEELEELALHGPQRVPLMRQALQAAGLDPLRAPFELLVRLGHWGPDEDLELRREAWPLEFSTAALREAAEVHLPLQELTDLRGLPTISIDAEGTRDVDDALSVQRVPGGWSLWVHLALPGAFLKPEGPLFEEALERATTLYLPDRTVPMLPPLLSEERLSLCCGQERPALSLLVELDEGGEPRGLQLLLARIVVDRALTYEEADEALGADPLWRQLLELAGRLRERRRRRGALIVHWPEVQVRVRDGQVVLRRRDREGASQMAVSECMILANWLIARWLQERGVAIPYRVQPPMAEPVPVPSGFDPLSWWRLRRSIPRAQVSLSPAAHAGLGVDPYTFATSPLRRALDLLVQMQLIGVLRGDGPPFGPERVQELVVRARASMERAERLERSRRRYWLLKYLLQRADRELEAVVLERTPTRCLVLLEECMMEAELPARSDRETAPGERVPVRVRRADPRAGELALEWA